MTSLTGCLGATWATSETESKTTSKSSPTARDSKPSREGVVQFEGLSQGARTEVERAIGRAGMYSECGSLALERELDLDRDPLVEYRDTLYEPAIMVGSAGKGDDDCEKHYLQLTPTGTSTTPATPDAVVEFDTLPRQPREEVRRAIQQDRYTSCEPLAIADEIDAESPPWISYEGAYYRPVIETSAATSDAECDTVHTLQMRHR